MFKENHKPFHILDHKVWIMWNAAMRKETQPVTDYLNYLG